MKITSSHFRGLLVFLLCGPAATLQAQVNISAGATLTENFDSIGNASITNLPSGWKADALTSVRTIGSYMAAGDTTSRSGGANMSASNGIYNFGSGTIPGGGADRAVGGLSSGSGSQSVNIYLDLENNGVSTITDFFISYDIEKYRAGTNAAGFSVQLFYSPDGTNWTNAGTNFLTSFPADTNTGGYSSAPGVTVPVSSSLNMSLNPGAHLYLAWNYSVTSGSATSSAQALGIDNLSITASSILLSQSDIVTSGNETANLDYAANTGASITTTADGMHVWSFTIRDGGTGMPDADAWPTILSDITISKGAGNTVSSWAATINQAALFDGNIKLADVTVTGESIQFTSLNGGSGISVADDTSKTLDLYLSFETSSIADNEQFQFAIQNTDVATETGSTLFGPFVTPLSSVNGDDNRIEVNAAQLAFVQQPSNTNINATMSPAPTVAANDVNGNRDLDYSTPITLNAAGASISSGNVEAAVSGLASFGVLQFSSPGMGITLQATSGSLVASPVSNAFDISNISGVGDILINQFSSDYNGSTDEYIELVNTTGNVIDLSGFKIDYQSAGGSNSGAGGNLSGILQPYSFWLLSPNDTISVGQTVGLLSDGAINPGFARDSGQLAIVRISDTAIIDAVGYGNISGGDFTEPGTSFPAPAPPSDGGIARVTDGVDNNNNSTDFTTVSNGNIYLRNSNSRLANSGALMPAGTYTHIFVTGYSSMNGDITVTDLLHFTNGAAFGIGAHTLTLNGPVSGSGSIEGSASSNLEIGGMAGSLNFSGAGSLNNLTLNNGATLTLGSMLQLHGLLTVGSSATLSTNNNLTLKSTAASATAMVAPVLGNINGNVIHERYLGAPANGSGGRSWRLLTSPLKGSSNNSVFYNWQNNGVTDGTGLEVWGPGGGNGLAAGPAASLRKFDAVNNAYVAVTNTLTEPLFDANGNKAFLAFVSGSYGSGHIGTGAAATNSDATGELITGTQTYSFTPPNAGNIYELIGNPYACPIDFDKVFNNSGTQNINRTFWVVDPSLNSIGGYVTVTYDGVGGYSVSPPSSQNQYIQTGQAFFVEGSSPGNLSTVVIEEDDKETAASQTAMFRMNGGILETLRINLKKDFNGSFHLIDGALVNGHENLNNALGVGDAVKFGNFNEGISILNGSVQLAIEGRQLYDDGDTVKIALGGMQQTGYQLEIEPGNFNAPGLAATLYDHFLNDSIPVSLSVNTVYGFSVTGNSASSASTRFEIVFQGTAPLSINFVALNATKYAAAVALTWSVADEKGTRYYEVEKSADGKSFARIALVAAEGKTEYRFTDDAPFTGNNYYRIKAVARSSRGVYSRVIKISMENSVPALSTYPNPATGRTLDLRLNHLPKGSYNLALYNAAGAITKMQKLSFRQGVENVSLDIESLTPGLYILILTNEKGEEIAEQKIIRR